MANGWEGFERDAAQVGGGGEFPEVPDDFYDAVIADVSTPETKADPFNDGKTKTDFYLLWEITGGEYAGTTLRQYIGLPEAYANEGYLNPKSNLHKTMEALGFDLSGKFKVRPRDWQGLAARIVVENKANVHGDIRPRITGVKQSRKNTPPPKAAAQKKASSWDDD